MLIIVPQLVAHRFESLWLTFSFDKYNQDLY